MDYQKLIIVGNVTRDAQRRTSKEGEVSYTTFRVAVSGGEERTTFFPVAVFGKYGETIAPHITKGRGLLVEGRIEVSQQGRFNVVADTIRLGARIDNREPKPVEKDSNTD